MMAEKITAEILREEYSKGQSYNAAIDLYETVRQNENFFIGRQWEGVAAPDLEKPVVNILKRVVAYFLATIVSDDVAAALSVFGESPAEKAELSMLSGKLDEAMELAGVKDKFRHMLRDAAVDGDGCMHFYFDPEEGDEEKAENRLTPGIIRCEMLDNTEVFFGNPQAAAVQEQPYILIARRQMLKDVRRMAKEAGCADWEQIVAEDNPNGINTEKEEGKVTVLRRYYKEKGHVWVAEAAGNVLLMEPKDTGLRRYPICWMNWDRVKNSYHGMAALTGLIPNQIFINKLFAMGMEHVKRMSFPTVVYDKGKVPGGWTNKVGRAIGVVGNPNDAIATGYRPPDMSNQVMVMLDKVISYTRDTMGASDAALGNVKPDNTSAIIASQKASAMPLELQRMEFYRFVEDVYRNLLDMMAENYGLRQVVIELPEAQPALPGMAEGGVRNETVYDFAKIRQMDLRLSVDVGASTYWSELMQVQTTDNLFKMGIIGDKELYVESIPDGFIRNKAQILQAIRKEKQAAQMAAAPQVQNMTAPLAAAAEAVPAG